MNNVWQNNSFQEEGSIVGSEDVIKQYDTLPSTEDGNAYIVQETHERNSSSSTRIQLPF